MKRRLALGVLIAAGLYRPMLWGQNKRSSPYRIGFPLDLSAAVSRALIEEMRRLGWMYEKDYIFVQSGMSYGPHEDEAARRVMSQKPDVIYVTTTAYAVAAQRLTSEIPIVMYASGYPVQAGVAQSLAVPGKNVTGNTTYAGTGIWGKLLQLLLEAKPGTHHIGLLWDYLPPAFPAAEIEFGMRDLRKDAQALALEIRFAEVRRSEQVAQALASLEAAAVQAVLITSGPALFQQREQVMRRLEDLRLPTITDTRWSTSDDLGTLIAYGPPPAVLRRQAIDYIYRILNGAKASELPIQQPSKFDLIVNLRTAKKIGLTVPSSILQRADEVIE